MYLTVPIPDSKTISKNFVVFSCFSDVIKKYDLIKHRAPTMFDLSSGPHSFSQSLLIPCISEARPKYVNIEVPRDCTMLELKKIVAGQLNSTEDRGKKIISFEIFNGRLHHVYEEHELISSIGSEDETWISVVEVEKNWELPSFSQAFTGAIDDLIPVSFPLNALGSYRSATFGKPVVTYFPRVFHLLYPVPKDVASNLIGKFIYDVSVDFLARFSIFPMFRRKTTAITVSQLKAHKDSLIDTFGNDLSYFRISEEWEAIPDFFTVMENSSCLYAYSEEEKDHLASFSSPKSDVSELTHQIQEEGSIENLYQQLCSEMEAPDSASLHFAKDVAEFLFNGEILTYRSELESFQVSIFR